MVQSESGKPELLRPGRDGGLVMLMSLMLTGMAIVREKEAGTIEQIMVTPIRPMEFISANSRRSSSSDLSTWRW
jgi:hypothetical protein